MNQISKTMVCALFIPAAPVFAVQGGSMPLEARNAAITSVMTDKLSETAAGLSSVQDGDNARTEVLFSRLYAGGSLKESADPVYANALVPAPAAAPVVSTAAVVPAAEEPEAAAPAMSAEELAASKAARAEAAAEEAAEEAAAKKKEEAKKYKAFKSGAGMMLLGLLLLLILL